ncbi:hypothetical protein K504DRAFT_462751 [Pleomassaria siparia CBS 279.74]|uniref:Uncharacterized protein n=1 Tax=Pleomassaria siparia CBS 279.74 TaxID=1314801 RepID=A0A6G1JV67_9PLEO|nr:hypothetical protein K504DRAFT_462751 [Pleomassaria siparia CBS 279.74]
MISFSSSPQEPKVGMPAERKPVQPSPKTVVLQPSTPRSSSRLSKELKIAHCNLNQQHSHARRRRHATPLSLDGEDEVSSPTASKQENEPCMKKEEAGTQRQTPSTPTPKKGSQAQGLSKQEMAPRKKALSKVFPRKYTYSKLNASPN